MEPLLLGASTASEKRLRARVAWRDEVEVRVARDRFLHAIANRPLELQDHVEPEGLSPLAAIATLSEGTESVSLSLIQYGSPQNHPHWLYQADICHIAQSGII